MDIAVGDVETAERVFTRDDVRTFTELSGDRGEHHLEPDEEGRLLVHGLLTATLATEIGGRFTVLARSMEYEFYSPVYTGQRIRCQAEFTTVEPRPDGRTEVAAEMVFERVADDERSTVPPETVMTGQWDGVVE